MTPPSVTREEAVKALAAFYANDLVRGDETYAPVEHAEAILAALDANPAARAAIGAYLVPDRLAGFRVREGDTAAVYPAFDVTGAYVETLARAIGVTNRSGWENGISPLTYRAWAAALAAEYVALRTALDELPKP